MNMLYSKPVSTYETCPDFSDVYSFAGLVESFRQYHVSTEHPQLLQDVLDLIFQDPVSLYSFYIATVQSMRVEGWHDAPLLEELVDRVRAWKLAQLDFYRG